MTIKRADRNDPEPLPLAERSVLYVEDNDVNWECAQLELKRKYKMVRARHSWEAFDLIHKIRFDLVLMDIELSGSDLNGVEIVQIIRGKADRPPPSYALPVEGVSDIPIIFVTAYSARYDKHYLCNIGGDEVISKPVDFTELNLAMSRLMLKRIRKRSDSSEK